ncbi:hypothetical protein MMC22_010674 [Lobaria immixta]|nr:hypothetical protein [Lobaria immixta]
MKDLQRELGEMRHELQARRARETALDNMEDDKLSRRFQTESAGDTDARTSSDEMPFTSISRRRPPTSSNSSFRALSNSFEEASPPPRTK